MKHLLILAFALAILGACNSPKTKTEANLSAEPDTVQTTLHVEGMSCDHCEMTIQDGVKQLDGIVEVVANHEDSTTYVKYDASKTSFKEITAAIQKKGYKVDE